MKNLNLSRLIKNELSESKMHNIRGGEGISCKATSCGKDDSKKMTETFRIMRENNPIEEKSDVLLPDSTDTVPNDTIPPAPKDTVP